MNHSFFDLVHPTFCIAHVNPAGFFLLKVMKSSHYATVKQLIGWVNTVSETTPQVIKIEICDNIPYCYWRSKRSHSQVMKSRFAIHSACNSGDVSNIFKKLLPFYSNNTSPKQCWAWKQELMNTG